MRDTLSRPQRVLAAKNRRIVRPRFGIGRIEVLFLSAALCLTGCLSPRYQRASKKTPPPVVLDAKFPPAKLEATLDTVIISGGPGSWKKKAYWDEYVVVLHNAGDRPIEIATPQLMDFTGASKSPGEDPWKLEKESKSLAKRYEEAGMTVVRVAGPRVLASTAEPAVAGATLGTAGAATVATGTAVALPVYGATVLGLNLHNRKKIAAEFKRRRLNVPTTLAPGETKAGSLFFPMVPNPQSLTLPWCDASEGCESGGREAVLSLEMLHGLHTKDALNKGATH